MYLYVPVYLILQLPNWISWNEPTKFLQEKHTGSGQLQRRARCSEGVQSAGRVGRLPLKPSRSGCCWSGLPHCNHTFLEVTAGCSIQVNCLWGSICFALASYKYYIYICMFLIIVDVTENPFVLLMYSKWLDILPQSLTLRLPSTQHWYCLVILEYVKIYCWEITINGEGSNLKYKMMNIFCNPRLETMTS